MKTDNELRRDVEMELQWDPGVDARDIGVAAKDGVVTLTGQVSSCGEKWAAERIAKRIAGVAGLANEIELKLNTERTDTEVAQEAALALKISGTVPPGHVKAIVERGWITLEGNVDWQYQKTAAEDLVRHLAGVKGVKNGLVIVPNAKPTEVRSQIEAAFERNVQIDARHISVEAVTERRQTLREMLARLQDEARRKIKDLQRDQEQVSNLGPADEMNSASTTGEAETHAELVAMTEEKLRYLDEALARLEADKYGRCQNCSDLISIERLMAIPFASYCDNCEKGINRQRGGWGHAPYDDQWTVREAIESSAGTRNP